MNSSVLFFFSSAESPQVKMTTITFASIMDKLKATDWYPTFIRHTNGDTQDNRATNLEPVYLREAFQHINDWKVDWVCYITADERAFLVNLMTPTPEIYHYMKFRAEKENQGFTLSPSFFKMHLHMGVRLFFGAECNDLGVVQMDRRTEYLVEYRAL